MMTRPLAVLAAAALALGVVPAPASAGDIAFAGFGGGSVNVAVTSMAERRWQAVVRQQYDYSCGSAAIATLLTYHYDWPIDESTVFEAMFVGGDQPAIRQHGFSMLDMRNFMRSIGFRAEGVRAPLDALQDIGVPVISLINHRGYAHFVVVRGITATDVLIGDPARGNLRLPRSEFEEMWNGTALLVRNEAAQGRDSFNHQRDRSANPEAPVGQALARDTLGTLTLALPTRGEFY